MNRMLRILTPLILLCATPLLAQQAEDFGRYTVHYNALQTSQLTPQVAQAYGIQRSSSRALLNITVMVADDDGVSMAVPANVTASARNLTGQLRDIELREISEGDEAIYYIGVFRVNNMETFDFHVKVTPQGSKETLDLNFRQQFYTE